MLVDEKRFDEISKVNQFTPTPLNRDAKDIERRFAARLTTLLAMRNTKPFHLAKTLVREGIISATSDRIVYNWQAARDMPSVVTLCRIAELLEVTPDYFLVGSHPLGRQHEEFLRQVEAGKQMMI